MKHTPTLLAALLLAAPAALHAADAPEQKPAAAGRPNLLFILADDLGWRDTGCYGSTFYETPNIDRLAARGVRLTQAYAANPMCSPTRASILTGHYPARIGITSPDCHELVAQLEKRLDAGTPRLRVLNADSVNRLKPEYFTLTEALREAGYASAHFGKWHLGYNGPYEPKDQGFQAEFPHAPAAPGPASGYFYPWKFLPAPGITGKPGEHIEDRMAQEAADYIRAHRGGPFFLNYWAYSVHAPFNARPDYIEHFKRKADANNPQHNPLYAAMVRSLDDGVGRLLQAVDEAGIADRTLIVFFSDNGGYVAAPKTTDPEGFEGAPVTSNAPLRRGKGSLYEGGTRVPCLIVWPGKTKAGATSEALFQSTDFYPTLLAMCGLKPRAGLPFDGMDQSGALLGQPSRRDSVFCHFPHGNAIADKGDARIGFQPGTYVRKGDWKLIRFFADNADGSDCLELYNLKDDPGETNNLAATKPEIVRELNARIAGFLEETGAVVPGRNPAFKGSVVPARTHEAPPWQREAAPLLSGFVNMYNPCVVETGGEWRYRMWFFGWSARHANQGMGWGCDAIFHARSRDLKTWEVWSGDGQWDSTMKPERWRPVLHASERWYDNWHNGDPSVVFENGRFYMAYSATSKTIAKTPGYPSDMVLCVMGATSGDGIHWEKTSRPLLIRKEDTAAPRPEPDRIGDYQRPCLRREAGVWKLWFDYWVPGRGVCLGLAVNPGDFTSGGGFVLQHNPAEPLLANWPNPEMVRVGGRWHSFSDPAGYPKPPDTPPDAVPWVGRQLREAVSDDGLHWTLLDFIKPDTDAPACHVPQALVTRQDGREWLYLFYATQTGGRPGDGRYHYEYDRIRAMRREIMP